MRYEVTIAKISGLRRPGARPPGPPGSINCGTSNLKYLSHTLRVVCRIRDGVITLGIERRDAAGEETEELVAEVPAEALAVGLQRGRTNMLMLATVHESKMFDDIYCFCDNSAIRNRWIAIFRRLGVAIFDLQN